MGEDNSMELPDLVAGESGLCGRLCHRVLPYPAGTDTRDIQKHGRRRADIYQHGY